jgi:MFS transporter, Spinster family, sphingosine-1-phosphate transporter
MSKKTYPYTMLAVLTGLNMLNYIDRNVLFGVQPLIQKEFPRSDADYGFLTFAFFIAYMVAAPCVGWLGDRFSRKNIVTVGILIWSGFTLLTWVTHTFGQLLFRHTIVGIGEASYATIAPTLIADSFPIERRGRMLAIFFLGLPFGSALGLMLGGILGHHFGWRMPFMVAALPGFVLAIILWLLPEPPRGLPEADDSSPSRSTVAGLAKNGAFITATLGMAMYTFAVGGMQQWIPTFLVRLRNVPVDQAGLIFGGMAGFNGIVATLLGGWLGDRLLKRYFGGYYSFSGVVMFIALPFAVASVYFTGTFMFAAMFLATFFLLIGTAPSNAALVNSVAPAIRSSALAVNIFVIHLLGDAFSPYLIGVVSARTNLQTGFWAAFVAIVLSGVILVYGARYAPRLKATG